MSAEHELNLHIGQWCIKLGGPKVKCVAMGQRSKLVKGIVAIHSTETNV